MLCRVMRAFSTLSVVCVGTSAGWPRRTYAVLRVRCRPKEAHPMPLAWDFQTQIPNLDRQFCVLKLLKTRRPYSTSAATESVTCLGQYTFHGPPGAVKRCRRPNESHVIRPILVISLGASSSDLEKANSSPSTNITCKARDPCHPPLVVLST